MPSSSTFSTEADEKGVRTAISVTLPIVAGHHQHGRNVLHEALGFEAQCAVHVGHDLALLGIGMSEDEGAMAAAAENVAAMAAAAGAPPCAAEP